MLVTTGMQKNDVFWHVASLNFCLRQVTIHEWLQFLEDQLFEFDERIVVIVLKSEFPKVVYCPLQI